MDGVILINHTSFGYGAHGGNNDSPELRAVIRVNGGTI